jgi:hypothetical protein
VVFAERVATLTWLRDHLPSATGLSADNIAMLHGRLSDVEQQEIVDSSKPISMSATRPTTRCASTPPTCGPGDRGGRQPRADPDRRA